ncbi:MAG TPA: PHP domain-containing protein [Acetivibrio sp.]|nr:PHP domain-containing protein [Acetivibrio sp.]HPT89949.1 PHP domain-containing protein [Acetivibrio sp.]HQA58724.1 PHP domain-containing protein [Acetivibrio sp.]
MKAFADLHIHSALSPCSDNDMTPNNIVNMAYLKGLDIIAITDHNSTENCRAVVDCGKKRGIVVVPGMELETREEVHMVCLFPGVDEACKMQEIVYNALPDVENREDIFGQQVMMDEEDNIKGYLKRLLLTASNLSIDDAYLHVTSLGGVVIPAHIDRDSYSMISNLGIIPSTPKMKYLEVSKGCDVEKFLESNPYLKEFNLIRSSDAHTLGNILERESSIELEELSIECLLSTLR